MAICPCVDVTPLFKIYCDLFSVIDCVYSSLKLYRCLMVLVAAWLHEH